MSYPIILNGDHAEFEAEWAGKDPKDRPDWPLPSFDAQDWVEAFDRFNPNHKIPEGVMLGWFANALMRGFNEAQARLTTRPAPQPPAASPGREGALDEAAIECIATLQASAEAALTPAVQPDPASREADLTAAATRLCNVVDCLDTKKAGFLSLMGADVANALRGALRDTRDAILALRPGAETEAAGGWQPIETALWYFENDVDYDLPGDADEGVGIATYVETGSPAYLVWWTQTGPGRSKATHWQPLPAAPPATPAPDAASDGRSAS